MSCVWLLLSLHLSVVLVCLLSKIFCSVLSCCLSPFFLCNQQISCDSVSRITKHNPSKTPEQEISKTSYHSVSFVRTEVGYRIHVCRLLLLVTWMSSVFFLYCGISLYFQLHFFSNRTVIMFLRCTELYPYIQIFAVRYYQCH